VIEKEPTGKLAASRLAQFTRELNVGDFGFMATLNDEKGRPVGFADDYLSGRPMILVFVPSLDDATAKGILLGFQKAAQDFAAIKAHVLVISATSNTNTNRAAREKLGLGFPVLSDPSATAFVAYGLKPVGAPGKAAVRTVVLTPFRQVQGILDANTKDHAKRALKMAKDITDLSDSALMPPHPPVLVIPNVLEEAECQDLIKMFDTQGELKVARPHGDEANKDYKLPVYDYDRQDRIDHIIKNEQVVGFLDGRIRTRVFPLIKRAFAFEATKHEPFHVARYVGPREGTEIGHRDNTAAETNYRRFALSISLNNDFEGGELVFREHSSKGYRGKPGTALIFSSALLHEIMETTKGVRYTLISHLF